MGVITSIDVQKKHANRWSIFIDNEFACGVSEDTLYMLHLNVGDVVDEDKLAVLIKTENYKKARESAFRLLGFRDRSAHEIESRLKQKGYTEDVIEDVLTFLRGNGFVNDELFAKKWVAYRTADTSAPIGARKILGELLAKGIAQETAKEAIQNMDFETEVRLAWKVILKKLHLENVDIDDCSGIKMDYPARTKLYALLMQKGFGHDAVRHVMAKLDDE